MNTKHTPGPWDIAQGKSDAAIYSGGTIAMVDDTMIGWKANAVLIAAAPDLLSVAVDTGRDFDEFAAGCGIEGYDPRSVPDFVATFIERMAANAEGIRAAIAKATAQQ